MNNTNAWGKQDELVSPVVLTSIMTEQQQSQQSKNLFALVDSKDLELAQALSRSLEQQQVEPAEVSDDYALALQLQEEEEASYERFRNSQFRHLDAGHVRVESQYSMNFKLLSEDEVENVLLTADDAPDDLKEQDVCKASPRRPFWVTRDKSLKGQGGDEEIITKHDPVVCGRRNVSNLSKDMSPRFKTGDFIKGGTLSMSNDVVNTLQRKLKKQQGTIKGLSKTVDKDDKQTHSKGLDRKTRLILQSFVNTGTLDAVHGIVSTGKEAIVYYAQGSREGYVRAMAETGKVEESESVVEYAAKVFKTTLNEFKARLDYVKGDHRFAGYSHLSHQNPRKIVSVWCEKELKNLSRMYSAGLPCPQPICISDHVLLMGFLGRNGWASPQLKETNLSSRRYHNCYIECALILRALYIDCKLVHADFSEYNIIYHHRRCYVIDVGQAVAKHHPKAHVFLKRDCKNMLSFFSNRGVDNLLGVNDLYDLIVAEEESVAVTVTESTGMKHCKKLDDWSHKHWFIVPKLFLVD